MKLASINGLRFWQFDLLLNCNEVVHASFLRHGGISEGEFASLNTSYTVGDHEPHVRANCEKIREKLKLNSLIFSQQCHGDEAHFLECETEEVLHGDALLTQIPGIGLGITHADCQAAIFYDPVEKAIASAHAGWRGSKLFIYTKTIARMQKRWGCRPENILACISPSLGPNSSEFIHYQEELPKIFWDFQIKPTFFDFWAISQNELLNSGILPNHIEIAGIDTYAHPEDYFSYRRIKKSGRLATVIGINALR